MKKLIDKYKSFLITLFLIIVALPILTLTAKCVKKIKNRTKIAAKISTPTPQRTLSLEGISESITIYELNKVLNPGGFKMTGFPDSKGNENYAIEYKAPFGGVYCEKKFVFTNDYRVKLCNYALYGFDDPLEPQRIYEEISNSNGIPDEIYFDKEIFFLQCTWYGKNGYIVYDYFRRGTIAVVFKLYTK